MGQTNDDAKKSAYVLGKHVKIGIVAILLVIGMTLSSCAIVSTGQGKGMAATGRDITDSDQIEEPEIIEDEKPEIVEDEDFDYVDSKEDKEQNLEEELSKDEDREDEIDDKNNPSSDLDEKDEDLEVMSIYNSVAPPNMIPSSKDLGDKKVVYLTFDDGPSETVTPKILDILGENDIKATFFVIGSLAEENSDIIKRIAKEGHTIANHSYSHDYKSIYKNTESFMSEIEKTNTILEGILGDTYKPKYVRLPGGGFGPEYDDIKNTLIDEGYYYITWNAATNDAIEKSVAPEKLFTNFKETLNGNNYSVVLMHDAPAQKSTPATLKLVIEYLKDKGYEFRSFSS